MGPASKDLSSGTGVYLGLLRSFPLLVPLFVKRRNKSPEALTEKSGARASSLPRRLCRSRGKCRVSPVLGRVEGRREPRRFLRPFGI